MSEWRQVVGFEGIYEVSSSGDVRSVDRLDPAGRRRLGQMRIPQVGKRGYPVINLRKDGKTFSKKVHHLVALAFIGPPPGPFGYASGQFEVNHKDGNRLNPSVDNLEYCTRSGNITHAFRTGLMNTVGIRNGRAKLDDASVAEIRRRYKAGGISIPSLATEFGVSKSAVGYVVQGATWRHVGTSSGPQAP